MGFRGWREIPIIQKRAGFILDVDQQAIPCTCFVGGIGRNSIVCGIVQRRFLGFRVWRWGFQRRVVWSAERIWWRECVCGEEMDVLGLLLLWAQVDMYFNSLVMTCLLPALQPLPYTSLYTICEIERWFCRGIEMLHRSRWLHSAYWACWNASGKRRLWWHQLGLK